MFVLQLSKKCGCRMIEWKKKEKKEKEGNHIFVKTTIKHSTKSNIDVYIRIPMLFPTRRRTHRAEYIE